MSTNANGCLVTTTLNLTIAPPPTIIVSGNTSVCAGHSATLTPSGALTYVINPLGLTTIPFTVPAGTYTITGTDANGCTDTTSVTVNVVPCDVKISPKVFLSGPYNTSTGLMNDNLRDCGVIPLTEPYTAAPYNKLVALEPTGETTTNAVLTVTGSDAIVDWVFLELRNTTFPYPVLSTRRALVQRNGNVVDVNGLAPVTFPNTPQGSYYVSIKHRNHLGVMTATPVTFGANAVVVDFTIGSVWIKPSLFPIPPYNAQRRIQSSPNGNLFTLWAGDANTNMKVSYNGISNDKNAILLAAPLYGVYRREDVNMDCNVLYNPSGPTIDRSVVINNIYDCLQNGPPPVPGYILYQHTPD